MGGHRGGLVVGGALIHVEGVAFIRVVGVALVVGVTLVVVGGAQALVGFRDVMMGGDVWWHSTCGPASTKIWALTFRVLSQRCHFRPLTKIKVPKEYIYRKQLLYYIENNYCTLTTLKLPLLLKCLT